jgi:hypothetical protein
MAISYEEPPAKRNEIQPLSRDAANRDPLEQLMKHRGGMTIRRKVIGQKNNPAIGGLNPMMAALVYAERCAGPRRLLNGRPDMSLNL